MPEIPEVKTRLDPLVRVREYHEKTARQKLAHALKEREASEEEVLGAAEKMDVDTRGQGEVAEWIVSDVAHFRARIDHVAAQEKLSSANETVEDARSEHEKAFQRARLLRRVADNQRQRQIDEVKKKERQVFDEMALMRFRSARAG
jgi:flagellar export protein FliJ